MMETGIDILKWINERSAPNSSRKYSRCVVCEQAWWDDKEEHRFDCWVPIFKKEISESAQQSGDDDISVSELCDALGVSYNSANTKFIYLSRVRDLALRDSVTNTQPQE